MGDVKELTPEFYYLDDMFTNASCLPLGQRQNGEHVCDVVLPPWAGGDPRAFVRVMRDALEGSTLRSHP